MEMADLDVNPQIAFHRHEGRWATHTAVQPPGRFGSLAFERGRVLSFEEHPQGDMVLLAKA
jgi:glucose-1-phosphate cytidylyltransferase